MCLVVKNKWHKDGKPLIAEEDLPVFKVLHKDIRRGLETPIRGYPIVFTDVKATMESELSVIKSIGFKKSIGFRNLYLCYKGIHAYINRLSSGELKWKFPIGNVFVYKAIIPKGTEYLIGDDGDIVSTKMIIFDKRRHER